MQVEKINDNSKITSNSNQLEILKKNFPQCFDKDGNFLSEKLNEIVKSSGADISKESYGMSWLGKSYARLLANENPLTLITEDRTHNKKEENKNSENMLIKGDNLEVLKHLKNAYSESIKMIYIDPPYNTGGDGFVYSDDRKFTKEQLSELAGISVDEASRILEFTQSNSNSHSAWLTFMYPRLYIARELLKDEGVIFIHIDENEQTQLRMLCDEVFGESNYLGNIIWNKGNPKGDSTKLAYQHEEISVYAKNLQTFSATNEFKIAKKNAEKMLDKASKLFKKLGKKTIPDELKKTIKAFSIDVNTKQFEKQITLEDINLEFQDWLKKQSFSNGEKAYKYIDENGDIYRGVSMAAPDKPETRSHKPFIHPITKKPCPVPAKRWRYTDDTLGEMLIINKIIFGNDEAKQPENKYLLKENMNESVSSILEFGGDDSSLLKNWGLPFENPKPYMFSKDVISILSPLESKNNDIILDFFAGSGTTAHAVMQLNAEDGGNRKYICVQLDEKTDKKSEAFKQGYKSIFDITKTRIIKASEKIKLENTNIKNQDFGFKIYETRPLIDGLLDVIENYDEEFTQSDAIENLSNEDLQAILTTYKVYDGALLNTEITEVQLDTYKAYMVEDKIYFISKGFTTSALKAFIEKVDTDKSFKPSKLVIFGYNFDSKHQREIKEAITTYTNKKSIEIDMVVRY